MSACFTAVFLLLIPTAVYAQERSSDHALRREIWRGTLSQTAPMPWEGPVEIYLRFADEKAPPQPLSGVISWPTLGDAKTRISGTLISDRELEFVEESCLSGDCTKPVLGGRYRARCDAARTRLSGEASGPFGLRGSFELDRWTPK